MMNLVDPTAVAHIPSGQRAARRWIAFVAALFLLQVGAVVTMICIATNDRSFALEPDYYQKAVRWDDISRQQRQSAKLGWTLQLDVGALAENGARPIVLTVKDRDGELIEGASAAAEWFHHARARDRHTSLFTPQPDGTLAASITFARSGLYEFRFTVSRGEETFVTTVQRDIAGKDGLAP
ncbi:MAG: FixH family protein [Phycisphaerales bacterium]|nr:FixH family protein [Phycisphaerales bacterium]